MKYAILMLFEVLFVYIIAAAGLTFLTLYMSSQPLVSVMILVLGIAALNVIQKRIIKTIPKNF